MTEIPFSVPIAFFATLPLIIFHWWVLGVILLKRFGPKYFNYIDSFKVNRIKSLVLLSVWPFFFVLLWAESE